MCRATKEKHIMKLTCPLWQQQHLDITRWQQKLLYLDFEQPDEEEEKAFIQDHKKNVLVTNSYFLLIYLFTDEKYLTYEVLHRKYPSTARARLRVQILFLLIHDWDDDIVICNKYLQGQNFQKQVSAQKKTIFLHCYWTFTITKEPQQEWLKSDCLFRMTHQQRYLTTPYNIISHNMKKMVVLDLSVDMKKKKKSTITFSGFCVLQKSTTLLYVFQCSSASMLKILNWVSSAEFASDNFIHVSSDFVGSDFCHLFTAPTIDGVDDPPVPGSPNSLGKHHSYFQQTAFILVIILELK